MRKIGYEQLELNPFTTIGEDNFLLTSGSEDDWNTMTAGWGGFGYVWNRPCVFVFVRDSRYTLKYLEENETFSLSFFEPCEDSRKLLTLAGTRSGRDYPKMTGLGIRAGIRDESIVFEEANMNITARKACIVKLDDTSFVDSSLLSNYPQGDWHYMIVGLVDGIYVN